MNNKKLDISINSFLLSSGFLGYFKNTLYKKFSNYKLTYEGNVNSEILLFINNEFFLRKDHLEQISAVKSELLEQGYDCLLITAERKLSFNKSNSVVDQFNKVYKDIHRSYKKVLVFCDTIPLQNYIVEKYNRLNIDTYSLQHGFYLEDSHEVFLNVYRCSNSNNFFVWDDRTLRNMKKHNSNRNYIKVGPHHKQHFKNKDKTIVDKVAIFGCGKDQEDQNKYLAKLYKFLSSNGYRPIFIGHPKVNLIDSIKFYFLTKVWIHKNKAKSKSYKLSLVLNSSVFLELEENGDNFLLLNFHFQKKILPTIKELFEYKIPQNKLLIPFYEKKEALLLIIQNLANDL